jgi:hypothetical protein
MMDIETISLTVLLILNFIALTSIFVRMENRFTKLEVLMEIVCDDKKIPHPYKGR